MLTPVLDEKLARFVVDFLNSLCDLDPEAIQTLVKTRVACNRELADHPTVQVVRKGDGHALGVLGLLNGLCGVQEGGRGLIVAKRSQGKSLSPLGNNFGAPGNNLPQIRPPRKRETPARKPGKPSDPPTIRACNRCNAVLPPGVGRCANCGGQEYRFLETPAAEWATKFVARLEAGPNDWRSITPDALWQYLVGAFLARHV